MAVIGGDPSDSAVVEVWQGGVRTRRREFDLDGAGMLVATIPTTASDEGDVLRVRVRVPGLGTLELDPSTETRAVLAAPVAPAPVSPVQAPAPAQLPRQGRLQPFWRFSRAWPYLYVA